MVRMRASVPAFLGAVFAAAAGKADFAGSPKCFYERDGIKAWSAKQLENLVLGDAPSWPVRLSRTPRYDASMRPAAWLSGNPATATREVVHYAFQLVHYELDEKANTLTVHGYETRATRALGAARCRRRDARARAAGTAGTIRASTTPSPPAASSARSRRPSG